MGKDALTTSGIVYIALTMKTTMARATLKFESAYVLKAEKTGRGRRISAQSYSHVVRLTTYRPTICLLGTSRSLRIYPRRSICSQRVRQKITTGNRSKNRVNILASVSGEEIDKQLCSMMVCKKSRSSLTVSVTGKQRMEMGMRDAIIPWRLIKWRMV